MVTNTNPAIEQDEDALPEAEGNRPISGADNAEGQQAAAPTVTVDDADALACYANFCRVSSTPEELILDLGLNPNPYTVPTNPIKVSQRIIMNHFTAKRLLNALGVSLQRHEQAFGVLETDIRKRVRQTT